MDISLNHPVKQTTAILYGTVITINIIPVQKISTVLSCHLFSLHVSKSPPPSPSNRSFVQVLLYTLSLAPSLSLAQQDGQYH